MPGGRPTIRTEAVVAELLERISNGEPLTKICADEHMPAFTTVWRWEADDEEFRKLSTHALRHGTHYLAHECLEIADDEDIDVQVKKVRIDTRLRLIGKWNAKAYGDATMIKHADAEGEKIKPDDISTMTRLASIAQALVNRLDGSTDEPG